MAEDDNRAIPPAPLDPFDPGALHTYPLKSRVSKVRIEHFARPHRAGSGLGDWLTSLPRVLAASDLVAVTDAVIAARAAHRGIVWGIGAHVVKTGLAPIVIDLMERGLVTALATNGAGIIHDFEIALVGATSEDVEAELGPGRFGMADETGRLLNGAINDGVARGLGLGQSVADFLTSHHPQYERYSLVAAAGRLGIPLTVHVAIGTDIIHMHPAASGASIGEGSLRDFRLFVSQVSRLAGGVYLNCGSAVVLPEVFLKAVAIVRNTGAALDGLLTVNMDFARLYRPETNVVRRPVAGIGRGISLVGHHELLIPLVAAALVERDGGRDQGVRP